MGVLYHAAFVLCFVNAIVYCSIIGLSLAQMDDGYPIVLRNEDYTQELDIKSGWEPMNTIIRISFAGTSLLAVSVLGSLMYKKFRPKTVFRGGFIIFMFLSVASLLSFLNDYKDVENAEDDALQEVPEESRADYPELCGEDDSCSQTQFMFTLFMDLIATLFQLLLCGVLFALWSRHDIETMVEPFSPIEDPISDTGKFKQCKFCEKLIPTDTIDDHRLDCEKDLAKREEEKRLAKRVACPECKTVMAVRDLEKHRFDCTHRPLPCQYCKVAHPLAKLRHHEDVCDKRAVTCSMCNRDFPRAELARHRERECLQRPATCPNCGITVTAEMLAEHLLSCEGTPVKCHHCNLQQRRGLVDTHLLYDCPAVQRFAVEIIEAQNCYNPVSSAVKPNLMVSVSVGGGPSNLAESGETKFPWSSFRSEPCPNSEWPAWFGNNVLMLPRHIDKPVRFEMYHLIDTVNADEARCRILVASTEATVHELVSAGDVWLTMNPEGVQKLLPRLHVTGHGLHVEPVRCSRCQATTVPPAMKRHESACPRFESTCPYCLARFERQESEDHGKWCRLRPRFDISLLSANQLPVANRGSPQLRALATHCDPGAPGFIYADERSIFRTPLVPVSGDVASGAGAQADWPLGMATAVVAFDMRGTVRIAVMDGSKEIGLVELPVASLANRGDEWILLSAPDNTRFAGALEPKILLRAGPTNTLPCPSCRQWMMRVELPRHVKSCSHDITNGDAAISQSEELMREMCSDGGERRATLSVTPAARALTPAISADHVNPIMDTTTTSTAPAPKPTPAPAPAPAPASLTVSTTPSESQPAASVTPIPAGVDSDPAKAITFVVENVVSSVVAEVTSELAGNLVLPLSPNFNKRTDCFSDGSDEDAVPIIPKYTGTRHPAALDDSDDEAVPIISKKLSADPVVPAGATNSSPSGGATAVETTNDRLAPSLAEADASRPVCSYCLASFRKHEYKGHVQACELRPSKCKYCMKNLLNREVAKHEEFCIQRTTLCRMCGNNVKSSEMKRHTEKHQLQTKAQRMLKVLQPSLGAQVADMPNQLGVTIIKIREDGAAAQAGLLEGDILVSVGGVPVNCKEELRTVWVARGVAGHDVTLGVIRGTESRTPVVTLTADGYSVGAIRTIERLAKGDVQDEDCEKGWDGLVA